MTTHATRSGQKVTIHGNTGVSLDVALGQGGGNGPHLVLEDGYASYVRITEDATHLRYFWHQLGKLLDEAEEEARAAQADNGEGTGVSTTVQTAPPPE